jgi:CRISPR-associated protein Csm2
MNDRRNPPTPQRPNPAEARAPETPGSGDFNLLMARVKLNAPSPEMFDQVAEGIARGLEKNKSSQVRRFFDEVSRFADRSRNLDAQQFADILPFVRMINARVAYARNRNNLVDPNFQSFMRTGLAQVTSWKTLEMFRLLFEAVIGFAKFSRD